MKFIKYILLASLICLCYPLVALAQNGAAIERGEFTYGNFQDPAGGRCQRNHPIDKPQTEYWVEQPVGHP